MELMSVISLEVRNLEEPRMDGYRFFARYFTQEAMLEDEVASANIPVFFEKLGTPQDVVGEIVEKRKLQRGTELFFRLRDDMKEAQEAAKIIAEREALTLELHMTDHGGLVALLLPKTTSVLDQLTRGHTDAA